MVLTKVDKIKNENDVKPRADEIVNKIIAEGQTLASPVVHLVSSHTGFGMRELKSDCVFILEQDKLEKLR